MKIVVIKFMLSMTAFFPPAIGFAQRPKTCGDIPFDMIKLNKALRYEKSARPVAVSRVVQVYFHICRNSDGSNPAITQQQLETEFALMVSDYSSNSLCFANMGFGYIDNTAINTNLDPEKASNEAWITPYLVPNCINIFYHENLLNWGGWAYRIPNTFCSITKGNIGSKHTITHEVGHCLGLLHTHQGCTGSYINNNNCATTGDLICDTPADPYCFAGDTTNKCFKNVACSYTGTCMDAGGATNWSPPYNNIMSYWADKGCTTDQFTQGQFNRINSFITTDAGLKSCTFTEVDFTFGPVTYSSGLLFKTVLNNLFFSGNVLLNGSLRAGFSGRRVTISPGTRLSPSDGKITVSSGNCDY